MVIFLDIDECSEGSHECDVNANCENIAPPLQYVCTCLDGYTGDGRTCTGRHKQVVETSKLHIKLGQ